MTAHPGLPDSYDIHMTWRGGAINLWGMGCAEVGPADTHIVNPIHWRIDDLLEHTRESLL